MPSDDPAAEMPLVLIQSPVRAGVAVGNLHMSEGSVWLRHGAQTALAAANIVPDPSATYTSDEIVAAIKGGLGAEPLVHCERGMVTEVRPRASHRAVACLSP